MYLFYLFILGLGFSCFFRASWLFETNSNVSELEPQRLQPCVTVCWRASSEDCASGLTQVTLHETTVEPSTLFWLLSSIFFSPFFMHLTCCYVAWNKLSFLEIEKHCSGASLLWFSEPSSKVGTVEKDDRVIGKRRTVGCLVPFKRYSTASECLYICGRAKVVIQVVSTRWFLCKV